MNMFLLNSCSFFYVVIDLKKDVGVEKIHWRNGLAGRLNLFNICWMKCEVPFTLQSISRHNPVVPEEGIIHNIGFLPRYTCINRLINKRELLHIRFPKLKAHKKTRNESEACILPSCISRRYPWTFTACPFPMLIPCEYCTEYIHTYSDICRSIPDFAIRIAEIRNASSPLTYFYITCVHVHGVAFLN